jgi:hypothetical protein
VDIDVFGKIKAKQNKSRKCFWFVLKTAALIQYANDTDKITPEISF